MIKTTSVLMVSFSFLMLQLAMATVPGRAAEASEVRVTNFPETQQIKGNVSVEGMAKALKRENILLTPSRRAELSEMFHAGKIETEGFTNLSVYLQGEIKSTTFISGNVGLILIPDEEAILRAFKEAKQIQFPIETICKITGGDSEYFSCNLNNQLIGFARYRMYLYNTLNKNAEVNAYLYLKK